MREEEAERAEQDEMERQERGMADMQAQQQQAEAEAEAEQHAAAEEAGEIEEERDLDDEIPDAEASTVDVTFNEDSMMEGSQMEANEFDEQYAVMEQAELTGAAQDEEDLGMDMERDLDDSVPEAGSYQHTDTELEESDSSESGESGEIEVLSTRPPRTSTPGGLTRTSTPGGLEYGSSIFGLQERMSASLCCRLATAQSGKSEFVELDIGQFHLGR